MFNVFMISTKRKVRRNESNKTNYVCDTCHEYDVLINNLESIKRYINLEIYYVNNDTYNYYLQPLEEAVAKMQNYGGKISRKGFR